MKIFMVDDEIELKCKGIIEECNKRDIDVVVATNQRDVLRRLPEKLDFDGIILDMAFPVTNSSDLVDLWAGEKILKELHRSGCKIPVLIFSKIGAPGKYPNVFAQMKYWDDEGEKAKFYEFIRHLESEVSLLY